MTELDKIAFGNYSHADRDAETAVFMGGGATVGKLYVSPPTPGVMSQLEMLESSFVTGEEITVEHCFMAIYLLRKSSPDAISDKADFSAIIADVGDINIKGFHPLVNLFEMSMRGFRMIPDEKASDKPRDHRHFDAEWLSLMVSVGVKMSGRTDQDILWNTPLCTMGFYFAQYLRENGMKGIGRVKDIKAMMAHIKAKREVKING